MNERKDLWQIISQQSNVIVKTKKDTRGIRFTALSLKTPPKKF